MIPSFRPLLAYRVEDFANENYPLLASPKIDGIRCIYFNSCAHSRTLRPIRNRFIQATLYKFADYLEGCDGELIVPGKFEDVTSAIMSEKGEPDFTFQVFDKVPPENHLTLSYTSRLDNLRAVVHHLASPHVQEVEQRWIDGPQSLMEAEVHFLKLGYEGTMVRAPRGRYKFGRSTQREGILGKIKRFRDSDAEVLGSEPLYHNQNPPTKNGLGLTERARFACNKVEDPNLMGKLLVRDLHNQKIFSIGSGFTERERREEWPIGTLIKYKHLPYGAGELPRHPIYLGRRHPDDTSR